MKKSILIVLIIIIAAIGAFLVFKDTKKNMEPTGNQAQTSPSEGTPAIINMKDGGYEPSKITIKKGAAVKFVNAGSESHWPASNIHPTHGIYPEFDPQKAVAPGESWTFVFDKIGTWRYHDHLFPNLTGSITVEAESAPKPTQTTPPKPTATTPPPPAATTPPPPAGGPPPTNQIKISLGNEETVYDYSTMKCAGLDLPDVYAHAVKNSQGEIVLASGNSPDNYFMFGPDFNNLKRSCTPVYKSKLSTVASQFQPEQWLTSIWNEGGTIYALIHNEFREAHVNGSTASQCKANFGNGCVYDSIVLGVSNDGGHTFTTQPPPTHVVVTPPFAWDPNMASGKSVGTVGYMEPSNIYKAPDGYYYSIFFSITTPNSATGRGTCVMRTQNISDPSLWRIWDGTGFNIKNINPYSNPVSNPASSLCAKLSNQNINGLRGSLTYNTYLGKYMLVGTNTFPGANKSSVCGFYLSLSSDLINWGKPQLIKKAPFGWNPCMADAAEQALGISQEAYPSVIDHDSADQINFTTADNNFYLYFMRNKDQGGKFDRDLIRVPVTITKQ